MRIDKEQKWTKALILREQNLVKRELDEVAVSDGLTGRLQYAIERIMGLEADPSSMGHLRRYIYIVSSLIHHERHGGLSDPQIPRLSSIASAILKIRGVRPTRSKLAFLYGDLHLALSQIYRKAGQPLKSAWEQQLSLHLSRRAPTGGMGFQSLSTGIRSLRLGDAAVALQHLVAAEQFGLSPRSIIRSRLERIKALRLQGDLAGSNALIELTMKATELTPEELKEFEWEKMCSEMLSMKDLRPMLHSVRRGQSHHTDTYLVDAFLWSRAIETREWLLRYPSVKSLAWDPKIDPRHLGTVYKCVMILEQCYDSNLPIGARLHAIGKILPSVRSLVTVEKELLVWAAMARWLSRKKSYALAVLPLSEYQSLSLRLSLGKNNDALGILKDLLAKPWFLEMQGAAPKPLLKLVS